jgi:starvation-inducible DNA-binding protein
MITKAQNKTETRPQSSAHQRSSSSTKLARPHDELMPTRIGLSVSIRQESVAALNHMLARTLNLRDLYKKNHWQTHGATFYQLHLLFDKHYAEQAELADDLAERVQTLGGVAMALGADIASESRSGKGARGRESVAAELEELCAAHESILDEARELAREAANRGDDGTNDLLVSHVVRTNELQCWFVFSHTAAAG